MPGSVSPARLTATDHARRAAVVLAEVFCVVGTLFGVGLLGERVAESAGGALAADATLIAPASPAFSIWTVIYLGLAAYTVWQFAPGNAATERTRATGWWTAASMVLNATWLLVTQQGWIWLSVVVIVALALVLGMLVRELDRRPAGGNVERVIVDGTFGLYLGWVAVATFANIVAALGSSGDDLGPVGAASMVIVAAGVCVGLAFTLGARWTVAAASAWGFAWIAVGRLADEPRSTLVGGVAVAAALVVLTAPVWRRSTSR
jgi:hypothetical protein